MYWPFGQDCTPSRVFFSLFYLYLTVADLDWRPPPPLWPIPCAREASSSKQVIFMRNWSENIIIKGRIFFLKNQIDLEYWDGELFEAFDVLENLLPYNPSHVKKHAIIIRGRSWRSKRGSFYILTYLNCSLKILTSIGFFCW